MLSTLTRVLVPGSVPPTPIKPHPCTRPATQVHVLVEEEEARPDEAFTTERAQRWVGRERVGGWAPHRGRVCNRGPNDALAARATGVGLRRTALQTSPAYKAQIACAPARPFPRSRAGLQGPLPLACPSPFPCLALPPGLGLANAGHAQRFLDALTPHTVTRFPRVKTLNPPLASSNSVPPFCCRHQPRSPQADCFRSPLCRSAASPCPSPPLLAPPQVWPGQRLQRRAAHDVPPRAFWAHRPGVRPAGGPGAQGGDAAGATGRGAGRRGGKGPGRGEGLDRQGRVQAARRRTRKDGVSGVGGISGCVPFCLRGSELGSRFPGMCSHVWHSAGRSLVVCGVSLTHSTPMHCLAAGAP